MNKLSNTLLPTPLLLSENLRDPDLYFPGIRLEDISVDPVDLLYPHNQLLSGHVLESHEALILPLDMNFGESWRTLRLKNGSPNLTINNHSRILNHIIYIYKHQYQDYRIMTQFHLVDDELVTVVETLNDPNSPAGGIVDKLLRSRSFADKITSPILDIEGRTQFYIVDPVKHVLAVDINHKIRFGYYTLN